MVTMSKVITDDGFLVRTTGSIDETVDFLEGMTRLFLEQAKQPGAAVDMLLPERRLTVDEYNERTARSHDLCVLDTFAMQLLQLRRMQTDAAMAIAVRFGNMERLWRALQDCPSTQAQQSMLVDLSNGPGRKVGPATSRVVADFFCADRFGSTETQGDL